MNTENDRFSTGWFGGGYRAIRKSDGAVVTTDLPTPEEALAEAEELADVPL